MPESSSIPSVRPETFLSGNQAVVTIAGTGCCLPTRVVSNAEQAQFVRQKDAEWIEKYFGIRERRFFIPLSAETGLPVPADLLSFDEVGVAEIAARNALAVAGMNPADLGGLIYVSCTQERGRTHFGRMALDLHGRLGLDPEALTDEQNAGCGGMLYAISKAVEILRGSSRDSILIVASNVASQFMDRERYMRADSWLSMYIFGDAASAIVLKRSSLASAEAGDAQSGILAKYVAVDPKRPLMHFHDRSGGLEPVYEIDAKEVSRCFPILMRRAIESLQRKHQFGMDVVKKVYCHQVNGRVLRKFARDMQIPEEKVAINVDRYGNVAAAAIPILLDEDIRAGRVGPGDLVLLAAVGAGAQYAALLVRL